MTEASPYHKQFIVYYPPGKMMLKNSSGLAYWKDNVDIASEIMVQLDKGNSIGFMRLEGWRIAQRRENGQFEEIFPDRISISSPAKGDIECNRCHNLIRYCMPIQGEDHNYVICANCNHEMIV